MYAIETKDLVKEYGKLKAVDSVSLAVNEGEIFGLLGPNGAGKTTLISMLVTMRKPTSGSASINGADVQTQPAAVRKSIGIVFQDPSLDEELTAFENLELHGAMYGISKAEQKNRIPQVMEIVGLMDKMFDIVKTFSGGMRRRLEIARGLIHYPKVLFLDEPTIGLDPQTRSAIWDYIRKLKKEHNITVVLTTHYMEEADSLCDRVAIIDMGKIIVINTPSALKDSLNGDSVTIETRDPAAFGALMEKEKVTKCVNVHDGMVTLCVPHAEKAIPKIMAIADNGKIDVQSVTMHKPTLDDVFLHYTGKTIREEEATPKDNMRMHMGAWRGRR